MSSDSTFEEVFPEVREIADEELRETVAETWASALAESDFGDLPSVPWWPPHEERVGSVSLVEHVRAVTRCAIAITDALDAGHEGGERIRRDDVVAGAILHDVSKVFEIEDGSLVETHELLPHPHLGVYVLAQNECSVHLQHVVLAHSGRSGVDPQTLEAKIVAVADELVVDEIYWRTKRELKAHAAD